MVEEFLSAIDECLKSLTVTEINIKDRNKRLYSSHRRTFVYRWPLFWFHL